MEIIQVQPSPENAEPGIRQHEQTQGKPKYRRPGGDCSRVLIPATCCPAFFHLKRELGLRSGGDTIRWLLHQVRPELVPDEPPKPSQTALSAKSVKNSVPRPVCMAYRDDDMPQSHLPVVVGADPALATRPSVRATVVQASTLFFDTPGTLEKAERLIAGAAAYGSRLVVFPEAFLGGYPRCVVFDSLTVTHSTERADDLRKYYASAIEVPGPEVDRLAKIAGKYKVHLVMGVVERDGLYLFSTVLFFNSLGQHLGQHRKLMPLASENEVWYCGERSSLPIYKTSIGKIGGLICWDNKLPLLRTELYDKGVEIYCAPTADAREVWKASMTHIALEGGCFVLSANQFCRRRDYPLPPGDSNSDMSLDAITCAGGSVIVSPSGTILAGPNYHGECLISADLDLQEITLAKREFSRAGSYVS